MDAHQAELVTDLHTYCHTYDTLRLVMKTIYRENDAFQDDNKVYESCQEEYEVLSWKNYDKQSV